MDFNFGNTLKINNFSYWRTICPTGSTNIFRVEKEFNIDESMNVNFYFKGKFLSEYIDENNNIKESLILGTPNKISNIGRQNPIILAGDYKRTALEDSIFYCIRRCKSRSWSKREEINCLPNTVINLEIGDTAFIKGKIEVNGNILESTNDECIKVNSIKNPLLLTSLTNCVGIVIATTLNIR